MASSSSTTTAPHSDLHSRSSIDPLRILAIDVGAGTQDVLVYESGKSIENCVKLVLPSQTQVVGARIRRATRDAKAVCLVGSVMGGGESTAAIEAHIAVGLKLYATEDAARSVHNDLGRVAATGVLIVQSPPSGAEMIWTGDVDLHAMRATLASFEVELPSMFAIAVQDHGHLPGSGGREFRYEFLQSLLEQGGELGSMAYRDPPDYMLRMHAILASVPGAIVMDTGAAAVLGVLGDPLVAEHALQSGAILVNIGNMHTFAVALRGRRVFGLFEHHTGGITPDVLRELVQRLSIGTLTHADVVERGGHGAAFDPAFRDAGPFNFVAITGPNRRMAASLGYHEAVPHGDMMLAGPYGLVEGTLGLLAREGFETPVQSIAAS